jgi:hypothetical protein
MRVIDPIKETDFVADGECVNFSAAAETAI